MLISQKALAVLIIYACLLGAALGLYYDLLRMTRVFCGARYGSGKHGLTERELPLIGRRTKRKASKRLLAVVVFLQDFWFCILAAVSLILLFYQMNNGKMRFSALLSAALGFALYRATVGKPILAASELIAFLTETVIRYLLFFICFPIRWIGKRIGKRIKATVGRMLAYFERRARKRYTKQQCAEAPQAFAGKGFTKQRKDRQNGKGKEKIGSVDAHTSGGHGCGIHRGVHQ